MDGQGSVRRNIALKLKDSSSQKATDTSRKKKESKKGVFLIRAHTFCKLHWEFQRQVSWENGDPLNWVPQVPYSWEYGIWEPQSPFQQVVTPICTIYYQLRPGSRNLDHHFYCLTVWPYWQSADYCWLHTHFVPWPNNTCIWKEVKQLHPILSIRGPDTRT